MLRMSIESIAVTLMFLVAISGAQKSSILQGPKSKTWSVNSGLQQLTCIATPSFGITIEWFKDGELFIEDGRTSILHGDKSGKYVSNLVFRSIKKTDEGSYQCKTNYFHEHDVSEPAIIKIFGPPTVNVGNPLPQSISVGWHEQFLLPCDGHGPPRILEVVWSYSALRKGIDVPVFSGTSRRRLTNPALRSLPREDDAMAQNVAQYTVFCTVTNSEGSKRSNTVTIYIKQAVGMPAVENVVTLDTGKAITLLWTPGSNPTGNNLSCTASFSGVHKMKRNLTSHVNVGVNEETIEGLHPSTSYSVSIQCRDSLGTSSDSKPYSFTTKGPPETPKNVEVVALDSRSFRISWTALTAREVHGTLSGYKIKWKKKRGSEKTEIVSLIDNSLDIDGLTPGQTYGASVLAFTSSLNGSFSVMKYATLPLFDDIVRPSINVSDISSNQATFTVTDMNSKLGAFHNCSIHLSDGTHNINVKTSLSLQPTQRDIKHLIPNMRYIASVVCKRHDEKNIQSSVTHFRTLEGKPRHPPKNLQLKYLNSSLIANWNHVISDLNGNFTGYNVCFIDTGGGKNCFWSIKSSYIFRDFQPSMMYTVWVSACTNAGCGPGAHDVATAGSLPTTLPPNIGTNNPTTGVSFAEGHINFVYAGIAVLVIAIAIVVIVILIRRNAKKTKPGNNVSVEFTARPNDEQPYEVPLLTPHWSDGPNTYSDIPPQLSPTLSKETLIKLDDVKYSCEQVTLKEVIGKGEFGRVYKADFSPRRRGRANGDVIEVAVKTMIMQTFEQSEYEEFVKEGLRMKGMDHSNVMKLIGICLPVESKTNFGSSKSDLRGPGLESISPMVIVPYMPNGDLKRYLYNARVHNETHEIRLPQLLQFAYDICCGMEYLATKNIVHRDLACRNCMLDANMNVVVSDFGLSRQIYSSSYYVQKHTAKMPVKWMALESLMDRLYTTMTDVWAFGVTAWELFTFCQNPFPGVENQEMMDLLKAGTRLKRPGGCPNDVWNDAIYPCWDPRPGERPTFTELAEMYAGFKKLHHHETSSNSSDNRFYVNLQPVDGYEKLLTKSRTNTVSSELNEAPMAYETAMERLPSGKIVPRRGRGSSRAPLLQQNSVHSDEEVVDL